MIYPARLSPEGSEYIFQPALPSYVLTFRLSTRARGSFPTHEIPEVYSVDPSLSIILLSLSAVQSVRPALLHIRVFLSLLLHFKLFILISRGSMPPDILVLLSPSAVTGT